MKITKEEYERLEVNTRKYLELMKQGNFGDARLITHGLESATYILDPIWVKGYEARQRVKV